MREIHWHPNNDEFQYFISGQARMTVFADTGASRTFDYRAGDVGYVPVGYAHYVQNTGNETVWFLEAFKSDRFESISLSQMMAVTPQELIASNLNVGPGFLFVLIGSLALLIAFSEGASLDWSSWEIISLIIVGFVSLGLFILRELSIDLPILNIRKD